MAPASEPIYGNTSRVHHTSAVRRGRAPGFSKKAVSASLRASRTFVWWFLTGRHEPWVARG